MTTSLRTRITKLPRRPLHINLYAIGAALLLYVLGFEILLPLTVLTGLVLFMPMPKGFQSWLSRSIVALLLLYALLQAAAVLQFLMLPHSNFKVLAIMLTLCTVLILLLFGSRQPVGRRKVVGLRDVAAIVGCLLFILPFAVTMARVDPLMYISRLADSQVVDGVAHYVALVKYDTVQSLDYRHGFSYPSGFHIATAFVEHSAQNHMTTLSWPAQVWTYFMQYMVLGLMLCYTFIYFVYGLSDFLKVRLSRLMIVTVGVLGGGCLTFMSLLLFVQDGFLNYFYICATILLGLLFLFEVRQDRIHSGDGSDYTWPLTAYLLLGAGVSLSWPMFAPLILLTGACMVLPTLRSGSWRTWRYVRVHIPIVIAALLSLLALYFQAAFAGSHNADLLFADGALHNFNALFLLIGMLALAMLVYNTDFVRQRDRLLIAVVPYVLLVGGLVLVHYFRLGTLHYYAIKCGLLLEIMLLAILIVVAMYCCTRYAKMATGAVVFAAVLIGMIVLGTVSTLPQPLMEIRTLFRFQAHLPSPPYLSEDSAAIAKLGRENKLQESNLTVLHYDEPGNRLFAQIGGASWANSLDKLSRSKRAHDTASCFSYQFLFLSYGVGEQAQAELVKNVKGCVESATRDSGSYYIVTDAGSVAKLKELFGTQPTYVVE